MQISFAPSPYSNRAVPRFQGKTSDSSYWQQPLPSTTHPMATPLHFGSKLNINKVNKLFAPIQEKIEQRKINKATQKLLDINVIRLETPEYIENLIKQGADLRAKDEKGRTALDLLCHLAPVNYLSPLAKVLLDAGARPSLYALHEALDRSDVDHDTIVRLLSHGIGLQQEPGPASFDLNADLPRLLSRVDKMELFSTPPIIVKSAAEWEQSSGTSPWGKGQEQINRRADLKKILTAYAQLQDFLIKRDCQYIHGEKESEKVFENFPQKDADILSPLKIDPLDDPTLSLESRLTGLLLRHSLPVYHWHYLQDNFYKYLKGSVDKNPDLKFLHPEDNPKQPLPERLRACLNDPKAFTYFYNWYGSRHDGRTMKQARQFIMNVIRLAEAPDVEQEMKNQMKKQSKKSFWTSCFSKKES